MGPRLKLAQFYIDHLWIIKELGHQSEAFFDGLEDATRKGLELMGNLKLARQVYAEGRAVVEKGAEAVGGVLISEGQELQDVARQMKVRRGEAAARRAAEAPTSAAPLLQGAP
jgi:hypothetical protein